MKISILKCPNCGADVEVKGNRKMYYCTYCGKQLRLDDDVAIRKVESKEKIRLAELEHEKERLRYEHKEKLRQDQINKEKEVNKIIILIFGGLFLVALVMIIALALTGNLS